MLRDMAVQFARFDIFRHNPPATCISSRDNPPHAMKPLAGWDGPACICEGVHRYSKTISWIRLYIDVVGPEFFGGICGAAENFELAREEGSWKRFATDLSQTPQGEPVLRLRGYATWEVVYQRISRGMPIEEEIETIEDLAQYLEGCFPP